MNNSTFIKLIRILLGILWHDDTWMTHGLSNQRVAFITRIRQTKGE